MLEPRLLDDLMSARNGDREAMDRLLAALRPHLLELARRHAQPLPPGDSAADLVQEAALRIWQKLDQFRGGKDHEQTAAMFHDWVGRIVRHLALDRQREGHAQRRQAPGGLLCLDAAAAAGTSSAGAMDPAASGPAPSTNVRADEQARLIHAAVENIADGTDRDIVRLCFFEDLSLRQVADRLGLGYDMVRERYHRSLRRLERELQGLL